MSKTKDIQNLFMKMLEDKEPHTIVELTELAAEQHIIGANEKQLVRGAVSSLRKKHTEIIMLDRGIYRATDVKENETDEKSQTQSRLSDMVQSLNDRLDEIYDEFSSFTTLLTLNKNEKAAKAMEDYVILRSFAKRVMEFENKYNETVGNINERMRKVPSIKSL